MTQSVLSVLIIEDEPVLARNIGTYLRRFGYEVRIASSAEAGLTELETFQSDATGWLLRPWYRSKTTPSFSTSICRPE